MIRSHEHAVGLPNELEGLMTVSSSAEPVSCTTVLLCVWVLDGTKAQLHEGIAH